MRQSGSLPPGCDHLVALALHGRDRQGGRIHPDKRSHGWILSTTGRPSQPINSTSITTPATRHSRRICSMPPKAGWISTAPNLVSTPNLQLIFTSLQTPTTCGMPFSTNPPGQAVRLSLTTTSSFSAFPNPTWNGDATPSSTN
ncbi:MAG: hypothetical protein MZV64_19715 [Ignavibacteriales bacterium]|nr:hypothetical protein [Ignavibacteriales bacterium]